ncbi:MAG: NAD(P)-dependent oxidoreductase [Lentisphaerota bacterium]
MKFPETIDSETLLEDMLSEPGTGLVEMMKRLDGDIMILGIGGKMGITLGRQAVNAIKAAGVGKKVIGVSRFSDIEGRKKLERWGIETISCDLLDQDAAKALPEVKNVIFMAGRKFGTEGSEELTWAMNTIVPGYVGNHFRKSRIVVFSTGCVYPLVNAGTCGCTEHVSPAPVGEYSQSCLGRERVFGHFAKACGVETLLLRLNYAIDLRYGVLHDIGSQVWNSQPVNNTVGHFNVLWQGDANCYALLALELCASPAAILNITGPEIVSVEYIAETFGRLMNKAISYTGVSAGKCYLNNAAKAFRLLGYPRISLEQMILWQAQWLMQGGGSLGKPTHFEVNNGKF